MTHDGDYLAEIGHVVVRTEGSPMRLTPCQLRTALTRVIGEGIRGRGVAAFGLEAGVDPALHLGVCRDGSMVVHAFGLVSGTVGAAPTCTFATTIGELAIRQLLRGSVDEVRPEAIELRVRTDMRVRTDNDLGTSVVELCSTDLDGPTLVVVAYCLLAACGAEKLDTPWCPRHRC